MASNTQADALNFYSELPTDQVIFIKSDTVAWVGDQDYVYTTGLDDYCLPLAQYSLDGQKWFNGDGKDDTGVYSFANPSATDDGKLLVGFSAPAAPQTLRIRIMCLAHPNQKPFNQAQLGSDISYQSGLNYRKIAAMGVINTPIVGNSEQPVLMDIPHNLGYVPNYVIFSRVRSANTFLTGLMSAQERPNIYIDDKKLHFDNYMTNPFLQLQAFQYFYVIYYD